MAGEADAVRRQGADLVIDVRLTPRGGRDAIDGLGQLADGRAVVLARVRAVPEDGKANTAILELLARTAGLPKSRASLTAGATARCKTIRLADADEMAESRVRAALGQPKP